MVIKSVQLDRVFHALADPTRRQIVETLSRMDQPVMQLAERFSMSQPAVTKHLGVLEKAGLIKRYKEGRRRRCRLRPEALQPSVEWVQRCRQFWEARLDTLEVLLDELKQQKGSKHDRK